MNCCIPRSEPIDNTNFSKEEICELARRARKKIFEEARVKTYDLIRARAQEGYSLLVYEYPENCDSEDIINLGYELSCKGFKTKHKSNLYFDSLEISWCL